MTPREKLIEKVAEIIKSELSVTCRDFDNTYEIDNYSEVAEAIIDYLKLEVVATEPIKYIGAYIAYTPNLETTTININNL